MELLVWHDALGSDEEAAGEDEVLRRVLYFSGPGAEASGSALRFLQGIVTFVRALRRPAESGVPGPDWVSITLDGRQLLVLEVEPSVFMALGKEASSDMIEHRAVFQALIRGLHDTFCLFHGSFDRSLRLAADGAGQAEADARSAADGMAVLARIQAAHRRVRKLRQAAELRAEAAGASPASERACAQAEEELRALEARSPAPRVWRRCADLFPSLLASLDGQSPSCLVELQGLAYFPMDQPLLLDVQALAGGLLAHLARDGADASAAFYQGSLLWNSADLPTVRRLRAFLALREQLGVNAATARGASPPTPDSLWMARAYRETFLPVWSSRAAYAECLAAERGAAGARERARSIHKLSPLSSAGPTSGGGSVRFRNAGLLLQSGYFARPSELPTPPAAVSADGDVWSPVVFLLPEAGAAAASRPRRVVLWHDSGLSLLVFFRGTGSTQLPPPPDRATLDRLADFLDRGDRLAQLAALVLARYEDTAARALSGRGGAPRQAAPPPSVYLNRVNLSFKLQQVPRLLRAAELDLFPPPAGLAARYLPRHSRAALNRLHALLAQASGSGGARDLCVRSRRDGWLFARKAARATGGRDLFVFLDPRVLSLAELSHALARFLEDEFGNVFF